MNIKEAYQSILSQFLEATKGGKLVWKKQNPTTVFIETISNNEKAIVSLQKLVVRSQITRVSPGVMRREVQTHFIFTVKNTSNNELVTQIDTQNDKTFKDLLGELYDACEFSTEKSNMDFLKGIIDNLGDKTN